MVEPDSWQGDRGRGGLAILVLVILTATGCHASPDIADDRCVPGRAQACECAGGESGRRVCLPDGRWGRCECRDGSVDTGRVPTDTDGGMDLDVEPSEERDGGETSEVGDGGGIGDIADGAETDIGEPEELECPTRPSVSGSTLHVSPNGNGDAAGTRADPLDVDTANSRVEPGDEVVFLAGTYTSGIDPPQSGTSEAPIVYRSRRRHRARFEFERGNGVAVRLTDVDHVRVRGFAFEAGTGRWVRVVDASNIVLRDLRVAGEHTGVGVPFLIDSSRDVAVLESIVRSSEKWAAAVVRDVRRLVIAGNVFGATQHLPLQVASSEAVILRGNAFHNPAGSGFQIESNRRLLFEDNLMANAVQGPGVHRSRSILIGTRSLARFNRFVWNWGTPLVTSSDEGEEAVDVYTYHNVFDRVVSHSPMNGAGYRLRGEEGQFERVVVKNNALTRLGQNEGRDHLWVNELGDRSKGWVTRNAMWAGPDDAAQVFVAWRRYGISEADAMFDSFEDNLETEPGYRALERLDHRLAAGSRLIDAAAPLTRAASDGSGTSLTVENAAYLFDGWEVDGEQGDRISVGTSDKQARVKDVDLQSDTLMLGSALDWSEGDPVGFPWSGSGPDIGLRERGATGRRAVGIEQSTFVGDVGDGVTFRIVEHGGVDAETAQWWFGDGTTECAAEIEHAYTEPGAYPVRLRVEDVSGNVHRATGLVLANGNDERVDTLDYNRRVIDDVVCDGGAKFDDNVGRGPDGEFTCVQ